MYLISGVARYCCRLPRRSVVRSVVVLCACFAGYFAGLRGASGALAFTQQPQDATVIIPGQATFRATATFSPPTNVPPSYQWQRLLTGSANWTDLAGATQSVYTTSLTLSCGADGFRFRCRASLGGETVLSAAAMMHVTCDCDAPELVLVRGTTSQQEVLVRFSQPVTPESATNVANYSVPGLQVLGASLRDRSNVVLRTSIQQPEVNYTVSVSQVSNFTDPACHANLIAPNTRASFVSWSRRGGVLRREVYRNIPGATVADLIGAVKFPAQPDEAGFVSDFEAPSVNGDSYGQRLSGFVLPPVTGDYVFFLAADEQAELLLSSTESASNRLPIASVDSPRLPREWAARSAADTNHISALIHLQGGRAYYVEALMKEQSGVDHLAVAWQLPGGAAPANGTSPIGSAYLACMVEPVRLSITPWNPATNTVLMTWQGSGTVEAAPTVTGPWQSVASARGALTITLDGSTRCFRFRVDP